MEQRDCRHRPAAADPETARDGAQEVMELQHRVDLSIRYHNMRRGFFDATHNLATALNVVAGSAVIVTALTSAPSWLRVTFAATVAIASVLNLVFRTSEKARAHHDLERRFRAVRKSLDVATAPADALGAARSTMHDIENDELPVKHYVVALAHNAIARKVNASQDDFVPMAWWQRAAAQFTNIGSSCLPTCGQLAEQRRR